LGVSGPGLIGLFLLSCWTMASAMTVPATGAKVLAHDGRLPTLWVEHRVGPIASNDPRGERLSCEPPSRAALIHEAIPRRENVPGGAFDLVWGNPNTDGTSPGRRIRGPPGG
jgi:hypothetical protein